MTNLQPGLRRCDSLEQKWSFGVRQSVRTILLRFISTVFVTDIL